MARSILHWSDKSLKRCLRTLGPQGIDPNLLTLLIRLCLVPLAGIIDGNNIGSAVKWHF